MDDTKELRIALLKSSYLYENLPVHTKMAILSRRPILLAIFTVHCLILGQFYFYAVSKYWLRENNISVLLL